MFLPLLFRSKVCSKFTFESCDRSATVNKINIEIATNVDHLVIKIKDISAATVGNFMKAISDTTFRFRVSYLNTTVLHQKFSTLDFAKIYAI